jgi:hypothetical protein
MKRYIVATFSALSLMAATAFAAEGQYGGAEPQQPKPQQGQQAPKEQGQQMGGFKGRHVMQGEVTKIDKQANEVTIRSMEGQDLTLHFPASALQNLNEGDRVSVELALRPEGKPSDMEGAQPGME